MPIGIAPAQLTVASGAAQVPLTSEDQLAPGVIITGAAWIFVRAVRERLAGAEGWILDMYPRPAAPHTCAFVPRGERRECATCHAFIVTPGQLLPLTSGGVPRSYIIQAEGMVEEVDPWTVYVFVTGAGTIVAARNEVGALVWTGQNVPIIPKLAVGWRLPAELRALVEGV